MEMLFYTEQNNVVFRNKHLNVALGTINYEVKKKLLIPRVGIFYF